MSKQKKTVKFNHIFNDFCIGIMNYTQLAVVPLFILLVILSGTFSLNLKIRPDQLPLFELANTSLWLSTSAYCPSFSYLNRSYIGAAEGFAPYMSFYDEKTDTNGYVGLNHEKKKIFVVFRGSHTLANWLSNIDTWLSIYSYCNLCFVHDGFHNAAKSVWNSVDEDLKALRANYSDYRIVFTGHSLGGVSILYRFSFSCSYSYSSQALATLTAIEAINNGAEDVSLITFGSPRVGNSVFSEYAKNALDDKHSVRITYHRDAVPHLPYHERFVHITSKILFLVF
jgi:predicted lipase